MSSYEIGRIVHLPGRSIYGFFVTLSSHTLEEPGILVKLGKVFSDAKLSIVHLEIPRPIENNPISMMFFIDFTGREDEVNAILNLIKKFEFVEHVELVEPQFNGLIVDTILFPLTLFSERVIMFRLPAIKALILGLKERIGEAYSSLLYQIGVEIGERVFESHLKLTGTRDPDMLTKICQALFQVVGYGVLKFIELDVENKRSRVRVWNSFECELYDESTQPRGYMISGILAGWHMGLFKTKFLSSKEKKCIAMGDPYCEFTIEAYL
ncbi:MAG: hypothetical protein DRJ32_05145 [Thermoprotei archaeon]|nr:MAG: hypothetical protein DRJ32_05145 [Thermoprotei archaeon]